MKRISYLSVGLALILMGCGGNDSSNGDNQEKISVPTKINMEFPQALKNDKKAQKSEFLKADMLEEVNEEEFSNKSRGYIQLKDSISMVEDNKKGLEVTLLYVEKLMPQIQEKCQDIPLDTPCNIEKDELSLTMDQELSSEVLNIMEVSLPADFDASSIPNKTIKFGKTTFTRYAESEDFQYALVMNMPSYENDATSNDSGRNIQTIKWSKDENKIWSIYDFKFNDMSSIMSLRYAKSENNETEMEIKNNYTFMVSSGTSSEETSPIPNVEPPSEPELDEENIPKSDEIKENIPQLKESSEIGKGELYLKLTQLNEEYTIVSNDNFNLSTEAMRSNSFGQIGKKGGYLNFRGVFNGQEFREKDTFDVTGGSLSSLYCGESAECNLEDQSTWLQSEDYEEMDDFFSNNSEAKEIIELNVLGSQLKENRQYLLLAPDSTIENKTAEDIFALTVGDILVDDKAGSMAVLFDEIYLDKLDSLVVVEVKYPEYSENLDTEASIELYEKEIKFKVLDASKRPTLSKK